MKHALWLVGSAAVLIGAACTSSVTTTGGGSGGSGSGASGGGGDLTSCMRHDDCIVISQSCCGSCGAASRGDAIAINADQVAAHRAGLCQSTDCPACYSPGDPTLIAACEAGSCMLVDLHEHPSTSCNSNSDCRLRSKDCCECGGGSDMESLIAINVTSEAGYTDLVCDDEACPECAPVYPAEARAQCSLDGFCEVVWN
jgi:hypothetical protein